MKRLFLALSFNDTTTRALGEQRKLLPEFPLWLRWTLPENLHITTLFLGDVDEAVIPIITESLETFSATVEPFTMTIGDITYAPQDGSPWMIWATFKEGQEFLQLAEETLSRMQKIAGEERGALPDITTLKQMKFFPHITLAHLKEGAPAPLPPLSTSALKGRKINFTAFSLMERVPASEGKVVYNVIKEFKFKEK